MVRNGSCDVRPVWTQEDLPSDQGDPAAAQVGKLLDDLEALCGIKLASTGAASAGAAIAA